ncbi:hypothetical protein DUI87_26073 [Hirundo rustica rustica]|uniref:Integrase catalytic domain-containing protein n=1 Tax=Hirundo rustica rustica TaxID=333673 RepID=A0A3M0J988_HIRRU|nr:hypothetical protein DUI87_26073 [Hirundo rustica rustica]
MAMTKGQLGILGVPETMQVVTGSTLGATGNVLGKLGARRGPGLLVDRSLFERELLRPSGAQGPAPNAFRATQFSSFVRQLYRYGFRKVPGRAGAAAPGDAGAWLHYTNPWFRRDRPNLLLRIRRRGTANTQRRAAGPEGRRRPPCGSLQLPGPRLLPDERHGRPSLPAAAQGAVSAALARPPAPAASTCLVTVSGRGPARREGPSRFQELYGERPLPAERELLRVPPCHFQGFHGEQLLPPRWEGPRSRMEELYGEQPPPLDRELLWMQPCSFQQLHREQQPPASNPPAAAGTSAPHAPAGSAGCAASTASSSAQNAPAQEESPALDLGQAIEKMIREIRNSLPVKAPSAQGNNNVAPESPGEDPMNRAAAEEVSSGTESCRNSSPEPEEPGVNPRGLKALELWQTDVTQVAEFGWLKYVDVTVDAFSSAMWASAHTGEKARDVIAHWRQAFAVLGIPSAVKTDNGPAYASQQVRQFLQSWGVSHNFGIPHSPTGQAIVERNHGTLKHVLQKQKWGMQSETPHSRLAKALYTINHLTVPQNSNIPVILNHHLSLQASDGEQQPRAKVRVQNLVIKQREGPYDLIAMGRGYTCVSTDTGTHWLPSKCVRPDLQLHRQNSADRQGGSRDQLESHQVHESSSDHSDDSSTDSD